MRLSELPLHVAVREWPEALSALRGAGVDVTAEGALPAHELSQPLIEALRAATAWRSRNQRVPPPPEA